MKYDTFVTKNMTDFNLLKNKFRIHHKAMADLVLQNKYSRGQIIFNRSVSLYNIFKLLEDFNDETKSFPKIGTPVVDSPDSVRYNPLSNKNLLNISLACLEKLLLYTENEHDLKKFVAAELETIKREIVEIEMEINRPPEILTSDFGFGAGRSPNKKPKVSIITTSMNLANFIEETIRSVQNQNCDDYEYIIIDGGSTDGSLEIIKKYSNIVLVAEKDTGYHDAFWKGVRLAKGDYILQCCVSDGYASSSWITKCIEILDNNKDVSLVWGFQCAINNESKMVEIGDPEFHYIDSPQKEKMFDYWLKTYHHYSEGNLCVRKSVLVKCYPSLEDCKKYIWGWLEFSYRFNSLGYLSVRLPVLANYFHVNHGNQITVKLEKGRQGVAARENYFKKVRSYKWQLMLGLKKHVFIDSEGNEVGIKFNRAGFVKEYIFSRIKKIWK